MLDKTGVILGIHPSKMETEKLIITKLLNFTCMFYFACQCISYGLTHYEFTLYLIQPFLFYWQRPNTASVLSYRYFIIVCTAALSPTHFLSNLWVVLVLLIYLIVELLVNVLFVYRTITQKCSYMYCIKLLKLTILILFYSCSL